MAFTLSLTDQADANERQAIFDPLMAFNRAQAPAAHHRPLNVLLYDDENSVAGGLWGHTAWGWLVIELLYLPEQCRGQGVGLETVQAAEQEARERECHGAWVDTFGWQARGFYLSLGYTPFGELPDYPIGHSRCFLQKRF